MLKNGTPASPATARAISVLPVPGGPDEEHAARDARAERVELLGELQELDDFLELGLGLVDAGDVGERHDGLVAEEHPGAALAEDMAWLLVPWAWRIMKKMKPPMMSSGSTPVRSSPSHDVSGAGSASNDGRGAAGRRASAAALHVAEDVGQDARDDDRVGCGRRP